RMQAELRDQTARLASEKERLVDELSQSRAQHDKDRESMGSSIHMLEQLLNDEKERARVLSDSLQAARAALQEKERNLAALQGDASSAAARRVEELSQRAQALEAQKAELGALLRSASHELEASRQRVHEQA